MADNYLKDADGIILGTFYFTILPSISRRLLFGSDRYQTCGGRPCWYLSWLYFQRLTLQQDTLRYLNQLYVEDFRSSI